ncbi:MAG TPA: Nre family DNA repair protein [Methanomicrobiales archaeon]|nr:Nre family DNA repair protein [Methanomicrobiales archaeon]
MMGKGAYLKRISSSARIPSVDVGRDLEGSTPPSVFIGSWNYPKVYAGPMIAPVHGDTRVMDTPEAWIPGAKTQDDILGFRMSLVRGKRPVFIDDLGSGYIGKLQEIALSSGSVESEATFRERPTGFSLSDEHTPYGPSGSLEHFDLGTMKMDRSLERVFDDGDLTAAEAVVSLHSEDIPFSAIQKAFSCGTMGVGKRRRLVPTRWSITACDSTIADHLLSGVKKNPVIDRCLVHESATLNNRYAVLLLPTGWQYEWMEAFLHVMGNEEVVFADHETGAGKTGYSSVGGCYYSCKMAVLEGLARTGRQAGAIVFREAYQGYVPMGVFNVRENVRNAMRSTPQEFEDMKTALAHISGRMKLPLQRFVGESTLLRDQMKTRQTTLSSFAEPKDRVPGPGT